MRKKTNDEFINECKEKFGNKLTFEKTRYVSAFDIVTITCKEHGDFDIVAHNLLKNTCGCPECGKIIGKSKANITRLTHNLDEKAPKLSPTEIFIKKARKKHRNKYDYSKVEYKKSDEKVCITCPIHGEFWQRPSNHLWGFGCKKCASDILKDKKLLSKEEFIDRANKIHNGKYDYSEAEYLGYHEKLKIICPIHGEFWQQPGVHLHNKAGCPFCANKKNNSKEKCDYNFIDTSKFIERAKILHLNHNYDYSKVEYKGQKIPVTIICNKHGEFQVTPDHFLYGKVTECPRCKTSKLEDDVKNMLEEENIEYIPECSGKYINGLGRKRIDVYIPSLKLAIECHGLQHFNDNAIRFLTKGHMTLKDEIDNDILKYNILKNNNIDVIYFYPKDFNKGDIDFYSDKNNIHSVDELKKYLIKLEKNTL